MSRTDETLRRKLKIPGALLCLLSALVVLSLCSQAAFAQNSSHQRPATIDKDDRDEGQSSDLEDEMKAKRAIKFAEKEYQENLDRARDLSNLSSAIATSFKHAQALTPQDIKKLEKVEKLAKGIRRAAGGSEDDTIMEQPPTDMASAVKMLGDLSDSLKKEVEKTPKHVISAVVIDQANVLLELIRIVRNLPSKA